MCNQDYLYVGCDSIALIKYRICLTVLSESTMECVKMRVEMKFPMTELSSSGNSVILYSRTEVAPIVGSEKQSEELVVCMLKEFEDDPQKIWESNIFGKSIYDLVNEGLHNKIHKMPHDARMKLKETVEKITNETCQGLICIII